MVRVNFVVSARANNHRNPGDFVLCKDNWNDYGYCTLYQLFFNKSDEQIEIGSVKIANEGMRGEFSRHGGTTVTTKIPSNFNELHRTAFSLGQDREYYENLMALPDNLGQRALAALNDVAADLTLFDRYVEEDVFQKSFLRNLKQITIRTQFHRIATGNAILTPFRFSFTRSTTESNLPFRVDFTVDPDRSPPTNMHVIIGSNGVGKSKFLRDLVEAAAYPSSSKSGTFHDELEGPDHEHGGLPFSGLVHIAFSAFESDKPIELDDEAKQMVKVVGLSSEGKSLSDQYTESLRRCRKGPRRSRWLQAMKTLSTADSILAEFDFEKLLDVPSRMRSTEFSGMSSGHKIVVLTMSRLVELVEERTLVLLDEPETHLHPPLLSALTRSISDLMVGRNGVAIVATHSPVVLQEVPSRCVSVLRRVGADLRVWKLDTESFGESVSRLTAEVFHLEVGRTGYHQVLDDLLKKHSGDAQKVVASMDNQLGSEGRFVLHALADGFDSHA